MAAGLVPFDIVTYTYENLRLMSLSDWRLCITLTKMLSHSLSYYLKITFSRNSYCHSFHMRISFIVSSNDSSTKEMAAGLVPSDIVTYTYESPVLLCDPVGNGIRQK
ncbi:hypothetical protein CDAR_440871 [Caerostris darwini]|uniref:Uncharacterized protein n=1 Tax=Caerostris darwini TaxID=1538125 RepID=A0AAV4RG02_9ARAC|nr:hypothetical protein CDAR_440871 [Caerostris darwini]